MIEIGPNLKDLLENVFGGIAVAVIFYWLWRHGPDDVFVRRKTKAQPKQKSQQDAGS